LATGVVVGLLLSAPILIPFAEFVSHSYVGLHSIGFSGLNKEALPILFFPWLYGSICTSSDVFFIQSNVGGFLSATQFAVIIAGLLTGRRFSLYIVLLLWLLICIARTFGLPLVSTLVELVPLLKQTIFCRYSAPSWAFCSAILCAIVIDDISLRHFQSNKNSIGGLLFGFSIASVSLFLAWKLVRELYVKDGYSVFLWVSLTWGVGSVVIAAFVLKLAETRHDCSSRNRRHSTFLGSVILWSNQSYGHLRTSGS
jgi:hypothetical protein